MFRITNHGRTLIRQRRKHIRNSEDYQQSTSQNKLDRMLSNSQISMLEQLYIEHNDMGIVWHKNREIKNDVGLLKEKKVICERG